MIVDSHTHLDALDSSEYEAAIQSARDLGVELIVTVGMDAPSSSRGADIAAGNPMVLSAVGTHPWTVQDHGGEPPLDELRRLAAREEVVAFGEIGLDFVENVWLALSYRDPELQELQERMFRLQVSLAVELGLPMIVHSRGAHGRVAQIMAEEGIDRVGGCLQFFEGGPEDVVRFTDLGLKLSVGSSVTHPDQDGWYETVRAIPDDALVLETDAPWLPYAGKEGDRSAPADLVVIARKVAEIRGTGVDELFRMTGENVKNAIPLVA